MNNGKIYLIGAGPGSLDLLTLGAVRAIGQADAILLDDLANPGVLEFAKPGAQQIRVGKRGGCRSTPQAFIHKKMIELARAGKVVARIKGGDPFMFGRGGEELQVLREAGVEVAVISGITAGMAASAALHIPLTHRECTRGVTFLTGHTHDGSEPDWHALAASGMTLVIYMGMSNLSHITAQLMQAGLPADTPAAVIQHGTLPNQCHVLGTLRQLSDCVSSAGMGSPSIVIIGEVVRFADVAQHLPQQLAA